MSKHPTVTNAEQAAIEFEGVPVDAKDLSEQQLTNAIPLEGATIAQSSRPGNTGTKLVLLAAATAAIFADACRKGPVTPPSSTGGGGTKDTIVIEGPGKIYYIVDRDTILIRDTLNFGTIINHQGDTLKVYGNDTAVARRVKVDVGHFAQNYSDPLGNMDIVHKMENFTCAVEPGYYDVPSNPVGRVRTARPSGSLARIDISNINPDNGYQKPLYDAIQAINGFLPQTQYPGYHMPDFSNEQTRTLVSNFCRAAEADFDGLYLTGLDNISLVSDKTNNRAEIEGALNVMSPLAGKTHSDGKKFIVADCLYQNPYANVAQQVGAMTPDIAINIPYPFNTSDIPFYQVGLRNVINGAGKDIAVHTSISCPTNTAEAQKAMAAELRDKVGKDARQGTHTLNFEGFFARDNQFLDAGDLDANHVQVGTIARQEAQEPPTHVKCDADKIAWYDPSTRSFAPPKNIVGAAKHEEMVVDSQAKATGRTT